MIRQFRIRLRKGMVIISWNCAAVTKHVLNFLDDSPVSIIKILGPVVPFCEWH